jgi:hypothetical protein
MSLLAHRAISLRRVIFDRYSGIADSGKPTAREIYGFTA